MRVRAFVILSVALAAFSLVSCGGGSSGSSSPTPTTPPSAPTGLAITAATSQTMLAWNASSGATGYRVKRSTTSGSEVQVGTATATSYTDTGLTIGIKYYYVVTAYNAAGESAASAEVSVTPGAANVGSASVDFGTLNQTIRGFGGSSAWIMDMNAHPAQADALFGNNGSQQIGLSILRVRIDPSGTAPGYATSNWTTELNNAKLAQQSSGGDAIVFATPWTPPAAMKDNNSVDNGGSLLASSYGAYADYLETFVNFMQSGGVSLYAISMQNEPDFTATYESCRWTGAQMDTWIANNSSVLTTRLMMPESVNFTAGSIQSLADPALNDSNAVGHIDIVAGHLYGSAPTYYANAVNKGKDVWATEHAIDNTDIAGALLLAKEVNDSMAVADYNAYVYWWLQNWIVGNSSPYENGLINDPAIDNSLTPKAYAMGQFSKFIRPGYVRADATYNPSTNVYVSAYTDTVNGHYVIVAINMGPDDVSQQFTIQGASVTSLTPYRTSATEEIAQLSPASVTSGSFTYTLPGQSITTFVQ